MASIVMACRSVETGTACLWANPVHNEGLRNVSNAHGEAVVIGVGSASAKRPSAELGHPTAELTGVGFNLGILCCLVKEPTRSASYVFHIT